MTGMVPTRGESHGLETRVERSLSRCADWSHVGRHRRLLAEVEEVLPAARRSFADHTNPRLNESPPDTERHVASGRVVPFPGRRAGGTSR